MEDDLNQLSTNIITNLDKINRILGTGRLESKLLKNVNLPDRLLRLSQQDWTPCSDARTTSPADRLSTEDVDALFAKIRHRSAPPKKTTAPLKKAIPLQQSRILNETNLVSSQSGSFSDLSESSGKAKPAIDVEALVSSLRKSAQSLGEIENRTLEPVDFERVERYSKREGAKLRDGVRDVEMMVVDLEKYVNSERVGDEEDRKELMRETLVGKLRELSETMSQVIFIKNNEYIPDMSKTLVLDSFPLAECLDDVNENIRQKKLYQ
ncbi:hypothetical protein pipiens_008046 [Culex pipiens pipiens]|uniref:Uncharacterized protein n=1 Tax=Culex pipiens pipiens TaxID=38569 RepID=A0ABD1DJB7_CULPP